MIQETYGELTLLRFERLGSGGGVVHAVTTRPQNYAPHHGVDKEHALAWRRRVCEILETPFDNLTAPAQIHGGLILRVGESDVGRGRDGRSSAIPYVDGLITDLPGVPMVLLSADCPLICVYDPDRPAIGVIHASWLSTMAGISTHLVERMAAEFGSDAGRLRVGIAPSAGPCCYEVGPEVRRIADAKLQRPDACFAERSDGRWLFDLWSANQRQLLDAGVKPEYIEVAGLCSICDRRFWSHRRDGAEAGRFALFMALR